MSEPKENVPESKLRPAASPDLIYDAPEMTRKPIILSRIHWRSSKNMKMNGHPELVGQLLLNRFGHSDMPGLSTVRDLSISAIISGRLFVERVVKKSKRSGQYRVFRVPGR